MGRAVIRINFTASGQRYWSAGSRSSNFLNPLCLVGLEVPKIERDVVLQLWITYSRRDQSCVPAINMFSRRDHSAIN